MAVGRAERDTVQRHVGTYTPPEGGGDRSLEISVAKTFMERMIGLMGAREFHHGDALCIRPCASIHTFFMRMHMDLAFLDRTGKVMALHDAVKPWRMRACLGADAALELPAGKLKEMGVQVGGRFQW